MIDYTTKAQTSQQVGFDAGLREFMLKVYNYMASALVLSGALAYGVFAYPAIASLFFVISPDGQLVGRTGLGTIAMFAPIAIALFFFMRIQKIKVQTAQTLLWVYAAATGISLSAFAFIYTGESIARTFFICASLFASMSIYGYTTKRDLTSFGSFLVMGVLGLILAGVVNLYMQSPAIYFATSVIGVLLFLGITAWDTQKIKGYYYSTGGGVAGQRMAIVGAFQLYLDFINLFLHLLRFFGDRR